MSEIDLQTFEAYLFSEDKQEFINRLVPNTTEHNFFSALHAINNSNQMSPEVKYQVKKYFKTSQNDYSHNLHIRTLLKRFDDADATVEEKLEIAHQLASSQYLNLSFSYVKPADLQTSILDLQKKKYDSTLDQKSISLEVNLPSVYQSVHAFRGVEAEAYTRLDTGIIANGDLDIFEEFIFHARPTDFENFPNLIMDFIRRKPAQTERISSIFDRLSLQQLRSLGLLNPSFNKNPNYIRAVCKKEFRVSSLDDIGKDLPKQDKRDLLAEFYSWVQQQLIDSPSLLSNILYEILQLDLELNYYDKDLFIEYLKNPKQYHSHMTFSFKNQRDMGSLGPVMTFGREKIPQDQLIRTYLEELLKDAQDVVPFNDYFDMDYLLDIFYTTKLMTGQDSEEASLILSPERLTQLAETKELKICSYNQEYFKGTEPVIITLSIKNIPSIMVKIFEFKPENYYLKEKKQLDGSINLDGLISSEEFNVEFDHLPVRRFTKDFTFQSITKRKQGIFIVDFIGSGFSSRAVIRKGKLSCIEHQTVAGQLFYLIDEETNICRGNRTGIWIKNRFYRADEHGRVLVPFSSASNEKVVLVHNDFAELADISLKEESFDFKCAYIYSHESFLMGNKAKVLLQPRLFLNGHPIGLDVIQECNATVTMQCEGNIFTKLPFEKLKISSDEETELEFPIPAKLMGIKIEVKASICPVNKQQPQEYTSNHGILIEARKGVPQWCSLYLRCSQDGCEIAALGKNGEPMKRFTITLSLQNKYLSQKIQQMLQTDSNGKVYLGKLEDITFVEARLLSVGEIEGAAGSWDMNSIKAMNYPTSVRICKGDQVILPLSHNELNRHRMSFVEVLSTGEVLRNCMHFLKIDSKKLVISGLSEGLYELYLKDSKTRVLITVYQGGYWPKDQNYLFANDSLIDIKNDINNIVLTDFRVQPQPDSGLADITIKAFADQPKITRFHVFAGQFINADMGRPVCQMDANLPIPSRSQVSVKCRKSQYMNDRTLGDEYCYVLDRKSQARYIGNTLEKPQVTLKRTFVRETDSTTEQLSIPTNFCAGGESDMDVVERMMYSAPQKYLSNPLNVDRSTVDSFLNFLAHPGLVYSNLKINEEGTITIKNFPYKRYSFVQVIASNLTSNVCEIFPLGSSHLETKDLTQKARSDDAVFAMKRTSTQLLKGETILIKDMTSSEVQVVDSLSKLFDIQNSLVPNPRQNYKEWSFLREWESLKEDEKLKKYDKYASHELNLFIYFKDNAFYKRVIVPFLQNKIEKTLVDYFLLNDQDNVLVFAGPERFHSLKSLEKILVLLTLQKVRAEEAKRLAYSLENTYALATNSTDDYNRYFDTVLTLAKVNEPQPQTYDTNLYSRAIFAYSAPQTHTSTTTAYYGRFAHGGMDMLCLDVPFSDDVFETNAAPVFLARQSVLKVDDLLEKRKKIQAGFQELEKTKEYKERQYYGQVDNNVLIPLNKFWVDLAKHIVEQGFNKPFLTENFIYAHSNLTEMVSTLSFMSLPFTPGNHTYTSHEGRGMQIQAGSDLIVFTKAVTDAERDLKKEIFIVQKIIDPKNRFTESEEEPGVQVEKEVDQYVINKLYSCNVILTNSSSSTQQLQLLFEIPEGAIPVGVMDYTKSQNISLGRFSTEQYELIFYFPHAGRFKTNPASVSKKGKVLAVSERVEIEVKAERTYKDLETLDAILFQGSKEDILNFAKTKNIWNKNVFNFNAVYWLLLDQSFFSSFISILRERKYFDPVVWQFGFYHVDTQTMKEYLASIPDNNLSRYLKYVDSSLLKVDKLKLLEYHPFVNQRVHPLTDEKNRILNVQLKAQYKNFLAYLCERQNLEAPHLLGLAYYLLLQDRVEEAMKLYAKIDREEVKKSHQYEIQYDYFAAYIDFFVGSPKFNVAREICKKYLDYPVLSWRSLFTEVKTQLEEYDGKQTIKEDDSLNSEKIQNFANANKEETLTMELQGSKIVITHQNVSSIIIGCYKIDLEVLFSRNPFINQSKDEFSFIMANHTETIKIENPKDLSKLTYEIPSNLQKSNLYIELKTDNKMLYTTYFSNSIKAQVLENYGQVKVTDTDNKPLMKVYVKCFAKAKNGKVSFYKDGYTDLRGRFDYATLNSNDISNIERFAIFIMSDDLGAVIHEANPPNQLGRIAYKE